MEKFGDYKFTIIKDETFKTFFYKIFDEDETMLRKSHEYFKYEGIARFAAIGHISLLEQGKG